MQGGGLQEMQLRDYPQVSFYTGSMFWKADLDGVTVRPLTFTGIVRGLGANFVRMNYWRFMRQLRILGFLNTGELERMSWRHFNVTPWRYQMWWRLRSVRVVRRLLKGVHGK